jgi:Ca2+-binding RTX toxin-like protein
MNRSRGQGVSRRRRLVAGVLLSYALVTLTVIGYTAGGSVAAYYYYYCPGPYCPPTTATLKVIKHVVNDSGGTAVASNFILDSGGTNDSPDNFPGQEAPGTDVTLDPGTYNVTETGPPGYVATFSADCTGVIAAGETKTCTVTNNDQPHCEGVPATIYVNDQGRIVGGPNNGQVYAGKLNGTSGADVMVGTPGNDEIAARGGNDRVCAGEGNDEVEGGPGHDRLFGEGGNDELKGGGGNDALFGGPGNDTMAGGDGNDTMTGGPGADKFRGGPGTDTATDFNAAEGDTKTGVP